MKNTTHEKFILLQNTVMGILINPKGRSLLHPEPVGRGASGHSVLEKQHLSNKMIVFQDALIIQVLLKS